MRKLSKNTKTKRPDWKCQEIQLIIFELKDVTLLSELFDNVQ